MIIGIIFIIVLIAAGIGGACEGTSGEPEGNDKPLKYPLMFQVCDVVLISKIDTREYFPFDDEAVAYRIHMRNPRQRFSFDMSNLWGPPQPQGPPQL